MLTTAWEDLDPGARTALDEAFKAWRAGGLPCGSAVVDISGAVLARGRNHAYDPPTGSDILEGTPLAHAEMNAMARLDTARDLSTDVLWSTQQPCAMCSAAIEFCGLGSTRYLAADPAFLAGDDPRGRCGDRSHGGAPRADVLGAARQCPVPAGGDIPREPRANRAQRDT